MADFHFPRSLKSMLDVGRLTWKKGGYPVDEYVDLLYEFPISEYLDTYRIAGTLFEGDLRRVHQAECAAGFCIHALKRLPVAAERTLRAVREELEDKAGVGADVANLVFMFAQDVVGPTRSAMYAIVRDYRMTKRPPPKVKRCKRPRRC